jgi:hypothetical protein
MRAPRLTRPEAEKGIKLFSTKVLPRLRAIKPVVA